MTHSGDSVVLFGFWGAFIIDLIIVYYAIHLSGRLGGEGVFHKTSRYAAASAFVFGLHHIGELLFEGVTVSSVNMLIFAEILEVPAALLLLLAVYQLYVLYSGSE